LQIRDWYLPPKQITYRHEELPSITNEVIAEKQAKANWDNGESQ
jgi:hypothetical protein